MEDLLRLFDLARSFYIGEPVTSIGDDTIGGYRISTVRLPFDHGYSEDAPRWYETMIFAVGSWSDLFCDRYATEEEAVAGHALTVQRVRAGELPEPS